MQGVVRPSDALGQLAQPRDRLTTERDSGNIRRKLVKPPRRARAAGASSKGVEGPLV